MLTLAGFLLKIPLKLCFSFCVCFSWLLLLFGPLFTHWQQSTFNFHQPPPNCSLLAHFPVLIVLVLVVQCLIFHWSFVGIVCQVVLEGFFSRLFSSDFRMVLHRFFFVRRFPHGMNETTTNNQLCTILVYSQMGPFCFRVVHAQRTSEKEIQSH